MKFLILAIASLAAAGPLLQDRDAAEPPKYSLALPASLPVETKAPANSSVVEQYTSASAFTKATPTTWATTSSEAKPKTSTKAKVTKAAAPTTLSTWTSTSTAAAATSTTNDAPVCPIVYTAQCCQTDVLGGPVAMTCVQPEDTPTSKTKFYKQCHKIGMTANCCLLPAGGDSLICNMP